jgi:hypothetical protein
MNKLDPVIEGYLSYLAEVGRKAPRTVIDVRCTLKRAADAFSVRRPNVPLAGPIGYFGAFRPLVAAAVFAASLCRC